MCEEILGETAGTLLFVSELFDRAEEDRGRKLVIVDVDRASSGRPWEVSKAAIRLQGRIVLSNLGTVVKGFRSVVVLSQVSQTKTRCS